MDTNQIILSKAELARAFGKNINTVASWQAKGLPYQRPTKGGAPCRFIWADVEHFLLNCYYWHLGKWEYRDPEEIVADARQRAQAIVRARGEKARTTS